MWIFKVEVLVEFRAKNVLDLIKAEFILSEEK